MVFLENTRSMSIGDFSIIEGHTIVMDNDKYCEYVFWGIGYGPTGIPAGDIDVTAGYVYNVNSTKDYEGWFFGAGGSYPNTASGGAIALNGVHSKILGGESRLAGSAGGNVIYYKQIQSNWTYGKAEINWYNSPKSSFNPFSNSGPMA